MLCLPATQKEEEAALVGASQSDLLLYLLKSWSSFFLSTAAFGGSTKYRTGSVKKLSVAASILHSFSDKQFMAVCSSVPVMVTNWRTFERCDCFNLC